MTKEDRISELIEDNKRYIDLLSKLLTEHIKLLKKMEKLKGEKWL